MVRFYKYFGRNDLLQHFQYPGRNFSFSTGRESHFLIADQAGHGAAGVAEDDLFVLALGAANFDELAFWRR